MQQTQLTKNDHLKGVRTEGGGEGGGILSSDMIHHTRLWSHPSLLRCVARAQGPNHRRYVGET